jgi:hypothetical protein
MSTLDDKVILNHYYRQGVNAINSFEDTTGELLCDVNPELEDWFYEAIDSKDLIKVKTVYNVLCRFIDNS